MDTQHKLLIYLIFLQCLPPVKFLIGYEVPRLQY